MKQAKSSETALTLLDFTSFHPGYWLMMEKFYWDEFQNDGLEAILITEYLN